MDFSESLLPHVHSPGTKVFLGGGCWLLASNCWKCCWSGACWWRGQRGKALLSIGQCIQKVEDLLENSVWSEGMRRLKNKCCPLEVAATDAVITGVGNTVWGGLCHKLKAWSRWSCGQGKATSQCCAKRMLGTHPPCSFSSGKYCFQREEVGWWQCLMDALQKIHVQKRCWSFIVLNRECWCLTSPVLALA